MSAETTKILARAAGQPLCDCVVIGVLPNGGGLCLDWNGTTTASLVMLCQAAIHEATEQFVEGINDNSQRERHQDRQGREDQKIRLVPISIGRHTSKEVEEAKAD